MENFYNYKNCHLSLLYVVYFDQHFQLLQYVCAKNEKRDKKIKFFLQNLAKIACIFSFHQSPGRVFYLSVLGE